MPGCKQHKGREQSAPSTVPGWNKGAIIVAQVNSSNPGVITLVTADLLSSQIFSVLL
jgi:hypothetical protein